MRIMFPGSFCLYFLDSKISLRKKSSQRWNSLKYWLSWEPNILMTSTRIVKRHKAINPWEMLARLRAVLICSKNSIMKSLLISSLAEQE